LLSRFSSSETKEQKLAPKYVASVILTSREEKLKFDPEKQTDVWFETLAKQLYAGTYKRKKLYRRLLDKVANLQ